jgi:outer membrane protein, multidrug efflux system
MGRFYGSCQAKSILMLLLLVVILGGCTVGPNYVRPDIEVPKKWSELPEEKAIAAAEPLDVSRWWMVFHDPQLDSLIDRAVRSNVDLRIAGARIREARAQRGVVRADAFPRVDTSASYTRSRRSENATPAVSAPGAGRAAPIDGGEGEGGNNPGQASVARPSNTQDLFQIGFDASWEIDVFGGVRRAVEAANADVEAFEENQRDVLTTLLAEVARNYLQLRGDQLRIDIALSNVKTQRHTLELIEARLEAGLGNELEVSQSRAQLAAVEARIPALESSARQAIHQLGVLLGQEPGALLEELSQVAPLPEAPPEVPVGLPSDLLRRRPDVRRAERELAAATARIGVATADFFPRFSLTGSVGQQSVEFSDLALSGSRFGSFGPSVRWPIFDAGRIRSNVQVQNARQEQALGRYESTILTSFQEVESALVAYSKEQLTRKSLVQAVDASNRAFSIANELYRSGLVDFLNVLETQRALYQSQDELAQSNQRVSGNLVVLFKALGGGW